MSTLNLGGSLILDTDYSTSEKKTGATWIDGKPIYRRVYQKTLTNTFPTSDAFIISTSELPANIAEYVEIKGMVHYATNEWQPANIVYPLNPNYYIFLDKSSNGIRCLWKGWYGPIVVTILYTKTTD